MSDEFEDLVEHIYEASELLSDPWPAVMREVAAHCDVRLAWLLEFDTRFEATPLSAMWGTAPAIESLVRSKFLDPAANDLLELGLRTPAGLLVTTLDVTQRLSLPQMRVYREAMEPFDVEEMMVVNLARTPTGLRSFSVFRSSRDGAFRRAERTRFLRLARHIGRATRLRLRLDHAEAVQHWLSEAVIDRLRFGVLVLDERLRVLLSNQRARRLIEDGDGLRLDSDSIRLVDRSADRRLRTLLTVDGPAEGSGRLGSWVELELPRRSGRRAYVCLARSLAHRSSPLARQAAYALFISDPDDPELPPAETLIRLWQVTRAEAEVCVAVVRGRGLAEVAEELGVSVNTVRTHLARVFQKTGTTRQAELVRLALSCLGPFAFASDASAGARPGSDLV